MTFIAIPRSGQNGGWHSDHGTHLAAFWTHKDHQDRAIWLWEQLAECYKDNPWIAGYNPLNEPACPSGQKVVDWYDRVEEAIRNVSWKPFSYVKVGLKGKFHRLIKSI